MRVPGRANLTVELTPLLVVGHRLISDRSANVQGVNLIWEIFTLLIRQKCRLFVPFVNDFLPEILQVLMYLFFHGEHVAGCVELGVV